MITRVVYILGSSQEVNVTLSKCGCATGIKQLALPRSAYSFDPSLQIDLKVDKGRGHDMRSRSVLKTNYGSISSLVPFSRLPYTLYQK